MSTAIEFNHVSKQYRLGYVSSKTLSADIHRWWVTSVLGKEDPYLMVGSVNDRSKKADSDFVWALRDIDFKVEQGDVVGIIGKNGAGKSTLLKLLSKVTSPTTGMIRARGRLASLLEVGTGFHGELTGRENIYMNGAVLGMRRKEISNKIDEIIDFSGCERYIDTPVKRYSSGMTVRLGFAVAAFLEPEILVVDEVLAVGDAEFQKKAIGKMKDVSQGQGRTVLFVSHNMASIRQLCKTGIMLENGGIKLTGTADAVVQEYLASSVISSDLTGEFDVLSSKINALKYVRFFNNQGIVTDKFYTGDAVHVEICVQNNQYREEIGVGLYFKDVYGNKLMGTTSFLRPNIVLLDSASTDRIYECDIDSLPLTDGKYYVEVAISVRNGERIDSQSTALCLNVFAGKPEVGSFMGNSYIDTVWTVR